MALAGVSHTTHLIFIYFPNMSSMSFIASSVKSRIVGLVGPSVTCYRKDTDGWQVNGTEDGPKMCPAAFKNGQAIYIK